MDFGELPRIEDCGGDYDEWMWRTSIYYHISLRERREAGDAAGYAVLLDGLRLAIEQGLEQKVGVSKAFALLARNTTEPKERLRLYSLAYKYVVAEFDSGDGFDEQGIARVEAATHLRQMGLAHEALGQSAKAGTCFRRALVRLQEGAELFETYALNEDCNNPENETFPLRPRLLADLKRVEPRPKKMPAKRGPRRAEGN